MTVVNRSTMRYFILWLLTVPTGLIYVFLNYPPVQVNWMYVAVFIVFGFLTTYYPMLRKGIPIFLVLWVTVPAFLMYGLFIEMIVMQISILAILMSLPSKLPLLQRFFINSTLFIFLSIIAAIVFDMVGGEIGSIEFWPVIIAVFCYQFIHTVFNDIGLRIYAVYKKVNSPFFSKDLLVDYAMNLVVLPLSLSFYYLLQFVGAGSFLLIGIPFFFISLIIRLYNNSERINIDLRQAGDIGNGLSELLTEKAVIDQFVIKVSDMFDADYTYLFDHQDGWLELLRSYEHGKFIDIDFALLSAGQGIAGSVLEQNKPLIYSERKEWESVSKDYSPSGMQSVLCVPISRNQKIEAVLFLASDKKSFFDDYQLKILDLLCSYFTVTVEKARYMQEAVAKNERCALTGLYNYRYLEERLTYEMDRLKNNEINNLSVVLLDIDYFKQVNDTYGHQSGNDILYMFAKKLEAALPTGGTVGRYGGEEFVYILPGIEKAEAVDFAEILRAEIGSHGFTIIPDLVEDKYPQVVYITSSIGVSSSPLDTDEAMTLLRNADRALYLGAKQAGRNRVAEYVK
ncbi:GGDEF domain-containing protein [Sporosarcina sp. E16_3]|uniref:sensor domain-containing diguanylate cyclase n=1 Tax=Sporosarcina sp. E16_3 TaxID=2789293 RepID=UPI001A91B4E1|nr:sensor domain-containing diguanylate cyclase [Sporosarcina sp. E16_3]MBO0601337.1 GGDEF domain-containing protein [Sporosarcina sp. E16_3]